jgi:cob(I)alamin adenosyltransferase
MVRKKIYTRTGDDGTTGLLYGGRALKNSVLPSAYGSVDEAQAVLGMARAEAGKGSEVDATLISLMKDLWVLMAELATEIDNRHKLAPGASLVTDEMVTKLEKMIDSFDERFTPPTEFVVPGENRVSALLDLGRTVVRRAERHTVVAAPPPSRVGPYLNRLSDLLWTIARWNEGTSLPVKNVK